MINAILATDSNGAMGFNGTLPWPNNKYDLERFREITNHNVVVMGRKTFDDTKFPKPLPNRICYVMTNRREGLPICGRPISGDIESVLKEIKSQHPDKDIFVLGGPKIILEAQPYLDYIYLTVMKNYYRADVRIQLKELLMGFQVKRCDTSPDFQCSFLKYENIFRRPLSSIE